MLTAEQQERVDREKCKTEEALQHIRHRIVVFSGKGGVGKTTLSVNLGFGLSLMGNRTGLLDADVTGPNVPAMLGIEAAPEIRDGRILPHQCRGIEVVSMAGMLQPNQPVIWRGPLRSRLLHQFITDVEWGELDCLVADLPPGTGDEIITMTQELKPVMAVIVTTPQEVSLIDCSRAVTMAMEMKIPHVGIVENMSGLICPHCGKDIDLFGSGGGRRLSGRFGVPLLGSLPFDLEARRASDAGRPVILEEGHSSVADALRDIARRVDETSRTA